MKFSSFAWLLLSLSSTTTHAFTSPLQNHRAVTLLHSESSSSSSSGVSTSSEEDPLGLTPELRKLTNAFAGIGDDKLRYKQLLYMANQLPPCPSEIMIPDNKVPGCLSTVYVDGTATFSEEAQDYVVEFVGDSDGLLTKGLVALLVRGLNGCTAPQIQAVNPEFIQEAQISQSLTPGRNNGFLNMLSVMKQKASEAVANAESQQAADGDKSTEVQDEVESSSDTPMYDAMILALQKLQPTVLELTDVSHQHAGHAGSKGFSGESHFELTIVAPAFDGLNLVKRHQLIYMLLGDVMPQIHALQIRANTPSEVENK